MSGSRFVEMDRQFDRFPVASAFRPFRRLFDGTTACLAR